MKRGKLHDGNTERGRMLGCRERKEVMLTMVLIEDGVFGNGLDRGHVDIVDDDRATRMQTDNHNGNGNCETTITHSIKCCSGTRTGNHNHKMGNGLGASARD